MPRLPVDIIKINSDTSNRSLEKKTTRPRHEEFQFHSVFCDKIVLPKYAIIKGANCAIAGGSRLSRDIRESFKEEVESNLNSYPQGSDEEKYTTELKIHLAANDIALYLAEKDGGHQYNFNSDHYFPARGFLTGLYLNAWEASNVKKFNDNMIVPDFNEENREEYQRDFKRIFEKIRLMDRSSLEDKYQEQYEMIRNHLHNGNGASANNHTDQINQKISRLAEKGRKQGPSFNSSVIQMAANRLRDGNGSNQDLNGMRNEIEPLKLGKSVYNNVFRYKHPGYHYLAIDLLKDFTFPNISVLRELFMQRHPVVAREIGVGTVQATLVTESPVDAVETIAAYSDPKPFADAAFILKDQSGLEPSAPPLDSEPSAPPMQSNSFDLPPVPTHSIQFEARSNQLDLPEAPSGKVELVAEKKEGSAKVLAQSSSGQTH